MKSSFKEKQERDILILVSMQVCENCGLHTCNCDAMDIRSRCKDVKWGMTWSRLCVRKNQHGCEERRERGELMVEDEDLQLCQGIESSCC